MVAERPVEAAEFAKESVDSGKRNPLLHSNVHRSRSEAIRRDHSLALSSYNDI